MMICAVLLTGCACNKSDAKNTSKSDFVTAMSSFRGQSNVHYIELSGGLLNLGKAFLDETPVKGISSKVKKLSVLTAEEASLEKKEEIFSKLDRALDGHELMLSAKDDGDNVDIYALLADSDSVIKELVIYVKSEATVVALTGNISMDDLAKIAIDCE